MSTYDLLHILEHSYIQITRIPHCTVDLAAIVESQCGQDHSEVALLIFFCMFAISRDILNLDENV